MKAKRQSRDGFPAARLLPAAAFTLVLALAGCSINGDVSRFAGVYSGTMSGDEEGTFTIVCNSAGQCTGAGTGRTGAISTIQGIVTSDGRWIATSTPSGATSSGTITADGRLAGRWSYGEWHGGLSGTRE